MKPEINFYNTKKFDLYLNEEVISNWIIDVIKSYGFNSTEINYSFYTDDDLLEINKSYLNHDTYTDIITFDNTINKSISADIALSYDRIKDNAKQNNIDFDIELKRVLIHGLLHCLGYKDDTKEAKVIMRQEEDKALNMFHVEHKISETNV